MPPHGGRTTSQAVAQSVVNDTASLRARVLFEVRKAGARGITCDEAEVILDLNHQTASPRFWELRKAGAIVEGKDKRPTRSGRKAIAWVLAP